MKNLPTDKDEYKQAIKDMIKYQLASRDITDKKVLDAMAKVKRHLFVPEKYRHLAYNDNALPIEHGQTISQPYIVAFMTQALQLKRHDKVLEVGTGSGYQAAILAELVDKVYTIERIPELSNSAKELITTLGYKNIFFKVGDGTLGWKEEAPFNKIIVTAATPKIPNPLIEQLADDGRLIAPVGSEFSQELVLLTKEGNKIKKKTFFSVVFVKLIGDEGFKE